MLVAKSYQELEKVGEPYEENGKTYVQVRLKSGKLKAVRVYSEREYIKMYEAEGLPSGASEVQVKAAPINDSYRIYGGQKAALGFHEGYITLFKGDQNANIDFFRSIKARYARTLGWYLPSKMALPAEFPYGLEPVRLMWEDVGADDYFLKPDEEVRKVVEPLIYEASKSEFQGTIGQRLEISVTVTKVVALETQYGVSKMYIMQDANENLYMWTTTAKNWEEGEVHNIRGTVKEHKMYRGNKETVLTRCTEI